MFERFTDKARIVVILAQEEARQLDHPRIGTEHLLLALLRPTSGLACAVLREAGLEHAQAHREVIRLWSEPPRMALSAADVAALKAIGIDADAVLATTAEVGPVVACQESLSAPRRIVHRAAMLLHGVGWPRRGPRRRTGHIPFTPRSKKVLELSLREALALKHNWIGPEHILLGLLREGNGLAAQVIAGEGLDFDQLRGAAVTALTEAA